MKRNIMVVVALVLVGLIAISPYMQPLTAQPLTKAAVWKEHRAEYAFATENDLLKGTSDVTAAAYQQAFNGCEEWPLHWTVESWATCKTQVPDSIYNQWRTLGEYGGTWSAWANYDSTAAGAFTTGASTHKYVQLTLPVLKPVEIQFRDTQVDGSAACSTVTDHTLWTY